MPQGAKPKAGGEPGKVDHGLVDLDLDDVEGVIEIFIDSDDCHEDDCMEPIMTNMRFFSSSHEVFVVRGLSKAVSGFRPAITCEGFLAHISRTSSAGYTILPQGSDHQLSFKYEPPSPKFSCRQPSCISYRLQLLHGSQFLYSLRGLPKALRCHRSAHALEWGPVQLVFAAAADLNTFLATLKYVEVEDVAPAGSGEGPVAHHPQVGPIAGSTCTNNTTNSRGTTTNTTSSSRGTAGRPATAGGACVAVRQHTHVLQRKDGHRAHGYVHVDPHGASACGCQATAGGVNGGGGSSGGGAPFFAATAGTAVLAAVAAACLLAQRSGGGGSGGAATAGTGRKRMAGSAAAAAAAAVA